MPKSLDREIVDQNMDQKNGIQFAKKSMNYSIGVMRQSMQTQERDRSVSRLSKQNSSKVRAISPLNDSNKGSQYNLICPVMRSSPQLDIRN